MSWTPTDEQVRLAKQTLILADDDGDTRGMSQAVIDAYERGARAVLVAAGPHIAAQAWDEAVNAITYPAIDEGRSRMTLRLVLPLPENPYTEKEAGR